jgi:D-alanine--poly(phosphoribitol) ligase subunit 2
MSVAERVYRILAEVTRAPEAGRDPEVPLFEVALLDSLSTVELMLALSREFAIDISPAEFEREQWATPRRIVADVEARLAR